MSQETEGMGNAADTYTYCIYGESGVHQAPEVYGKAYWWITAKTDSWNGEVQYKHEPMFGIIYFLFYYLQHYILNTPYYYAVNVEFVLIQHDSYHKKMIHTSTNLNMKP